MTDGLLLEALELLPDAIALFDADDRLAAWNSRYDEIYSRETPLALGQRFIDIIRAAVTDGLVPSSKGREEEWIAERMERHRQPGSTQEQLFANGRWIRTQERRSRDGWTIGIRSDISEAKRREDSFRLLFDANPVPMYVSDRATLGFVSVNDAALALFGHERSGFLALDLLSIRPERERGAFQRLLAQGEFGDYDGLRHWTYLKADGGEVAVIPHTKSLDLGGRSVVLTSLTDVTERLAAEHEAQRSRDLLDSVVDLIPVGVFVKDMADEGRYVIHNRHGGEIVGREPGAMVGLRDGDLFDPEIAAVLADRDRDAMRAGELRESHREIASGSRDPPRTLREKRVPIRDGPDGELRYLLGVFEDVTERETMAARLDRMAHHDALTGLPNRVVLDRRLADLAAVGAGGPPTALLYLDLDGFKGVNDTLGHRVGDGLLRAVAERMARLIRSPDLAVRLGGDEFVMLATAGSDGALLAGRRLAGRVIEALSRPYAVEGHAIAITASVGIAAVDAAGRGTESALRDADVALYAAKRTGAGTALAFSPEMDAEARLRRDLADDIRRGIDAGEFEVHYQPIFTVGQGRLAGFEAQMRWRHPARGVLSSAGYAARAEELGLMPGLGSLALAQACRDAVDWPPSVALAFELSETQFRDDGLLGAVISALGDAGLAPERLELEVAESVLADDMMRAAATLEALRRLGVRVAVDGLGMAHASMGCLGRLTIDAIRVGRALAQAAPQDRRSAAILRAVVGLAKDLDLVATAVGIDAAEHLDGAVRAGCARVQGDLLGRADTARAALERCRSADATQAA